MPKLLFKKLNHLIIVKARASVSVTFASSQTRNLSYLFLQTHTFSSSSSVESVENSSYRSSIVVDYLINSCGLTPKKAVLASKYVKFKVADKPNSVLTFFKNQGFTQTQISKLIVNNPFVLRSDPDKTFLPKLEFLKSKGLSDPDVVLIICKWPRILTRSLENQLIPSFNFFSNLILSNERNFSALKRCLGVLLLDLEKHGSENIEILKKAGVPGRNIGYLLANQPRVFLATCDKIKQTVDEVTKMGFDPSNINFMIAVHALRSMSKSNWDKKVEVYKKWGWSEDDFVVAFKKYPWCMTLSEDKISLVMDLWVNKMGWNSSLLAQRPIVMLYSFEKRIAPRYEVYQFLVSRSIVNPTYKTFASMLSYTESHFIKKIIESHKEEASHLLKLYKQKLGLAK